MIEAPVVTLTLSADTVYLSDGGAVQFSAAAAGAVSWQWDFGDSDTSSEAAPEHRYTRAGSFLVTVTVSNGLCSTVQRRTVVVLQVNATGDLPAFAASVELGNNYPNPVSSVTAVPFSLPARMQLRLRVYDALGRVAATLAEGAFDAGSHTVLWQAESLPSGVYHLVLEADGQRRLRQVSISR